MPCDTIQKSTIEFGPKTDVLLLAKALASLGWTQVGEVTKTSLWFRDPTTYAQARFVGGKLEISQSAYRKVEENPIKRAYSTEVVKAAGNKFGWSTKQTGEFQLQATRRF